MLRELTTALLGGDATRVGGFAVKFTGVVYPGETIRVRGWQEDGRILGQATVGRRAVTGTARPCSATSC